MDTSEAYVKMCDCPEVQGWKMFKYNDIHSQHSQKDFVSFSHTKPNVWKKIVWLPRQDQIQETMPGLDAFQKIYKLAEYIERNDAKYLMGEENRSIEQLWLAFYMHEKHGKAWDGEKWGKK